MTLLLVGAGVNGVWGSYDREMKIALVLAAAVAAAQIDDEFQIRDELTSALMSLQSRDREAKQLADALTARILAVPEPMNPPSRVTLTGLALELARTLTGRELKRPAAVLLAADITGALRSASMGTAAFREHLARFGKSLSDLGVNASTTRSLTAKLRAAGEEARGPQDAPLMPFR